jgi:hypothetical protein
VHQVVALHRRLERAGEADRAGVVDQDVDAPEGLDGLRHRGQHLGLLADVDHQGSALPPAASISCAAV